MKKSIKLSFVVVLTIVSTLFSCSSDNDTNSSDTNELVGEWQRVDSNSSFATGFVFNVNNTGLKFSSESFDDGTAISNAVELQWNISNANLQLMMHEEVSTPYSFNEEGQLILSAISEIPYVRID